MYIKRKRLTILLITTIVLVIAIAFVLFMNYKNHKYKNTSLTFEQKDLNISIYNHLIQNTYKLNDLEIASSDFDSTYNWEDAKKASQNLGKGWRLPNMAELSFLFKHRKEIGGFKEEKYWSGDEYQRNVTAYEMLFNYQGFRDVSPIHSELNVRAVKDYNK